MGRRGLLQKLHVEGAPECIALQPGTCNYASKPPATCLYMASQLGSQRFQLMQLLDRAEAHQVLLSEWKPLNSEGIHVEPRRGFGASAWASLVSESLSLPLCGEPGPGPPLTLPCPRPRAGPIPRQWA